MSVVAQLTVWAAMRPSAVQPKPRTTCRANGVEAGVDESSAMAASSTALRRTRGRFGARFQRCRTSLYLRRAIQGKPPPRQGGRVGRARSRRSGPRARA